MKKAIYYRYLALVATAVLICAAVAFGIFSTTSISDKQQHMLSLLRVMETTFTDTDDLMQATQLSALTDGARVTIVSSDGVVIDDSEHSKDAMENHLQRKEIAQAIKTGSGMDIRESGTLGRKQIYVAYRMSDGNVIRMSYDTEGAENYAGQIIPAIVVAVLLGMIVSFLIVSGLTQRIRKPLTELRNALSVMKNGGFSAQVVECEFEEINDLIYAFNAMGGDIRQSVAQLENERTKVDFILESMEEGLVLIDGRLEIIHANHAAKQFFSCDFEVQSKNILYLVHNSRVYDAIERGAQEHLSSLFDIELSGRTLQIHITPLQSEFLGEGDRASGAIMVVTDTTGERASQRMRQEFFSNASHELKTPITSVSGFAELLQSGLADPEHEKEYIARIRGEAKRMSALIEDILKISRLESGADANQSVYTQVELKGLCEEISENLLPQAAQADISLSVSGEDCALLADRRHMHELCANLIENAVKYNKPQGRVEVILEEDAMRKQVRLTVKDTGIGIPLAHQNRIFERFYRVDKGRSTKVGSTGLGLSIVKHIVGVYGGEISLMSRENMGTTIVITLPIERSFDQ